MSLKKIILISLLNLLFLTNCKTLKTVKLMKGGGTSQKEFVVEVPFEYRLGLIILKVKIKGIEYDFVLDTGAPNVISKELANTLNLKQLFSQKVEDSQNSDSDLSIAKIDNINIGGIDFNNTGIVISDIKNSQEIGCLNIDGFIGSNLMKKAIWKFDYQRKIIVITNTLDSLKITGNIKKIPFFTEITGTPLCDIQVNNHIEKNIVIDLGSNGDITLSNKTYNKIINSSISKMTNYGKSSSGLYGTGDLNTTNFIIASKITFGDVTLKNQIIEFSKGSSTIGMNFFKNYDIIIDWFDKEILLIKKKEYDYSTITNFGFLWFNEDGKLIINSLTVGSIAENSGLKIGDQIININGDDYTHISKEKWCDMIQNQFISNEITLTILRKNEKINFHLYSETLLK